MYKQSHSGLPPRATRQDGRAMPDKPPGWLRAFFLGSHQTRLTLTRVMTGLIDP
jgi:hypothetical protein